MSHPIASRACRLAAAALTITLAAPTLAAQQSSAAPTATARVADSAAKAESTPHRGRFGRLFDKAKRAAASTGVSKETAARLAMTAATGGAAAAMMTAREQGAASVATAASRALTPHPSMASLAMTGSSTPSARSAVSQEAVRAMSDLGSISQRAAMHDPAAVRAIQALNVAMSKPDAQLVALQKRATAGDATAVQQMMIREDAIAHAALVAGAP